MKKAIMVFTIIFFSLMLILTLFAEQMHRLSLPKVTVSPPEHKSFSYEYTDENGNVQTSSVQKIALPKSLCGQDVYVIYTAEKNGTKRSFVKLVNVETGDEREGYVEVISGINSADRIVMESSLDLFDGCEVVVE